MRLSLHTKHRRLVISTGDDAVRADAAEDIMIQMGGGDFQIVPTEAIEYVEEPDEGSMRFGFQPLRLVPQA